MKPHYFFRPHQTLQRIRQALGQVPAASILCRLPWGLLLRVDPREDIGRAIWQLGLYDLAVCEALWRLTSPGDLVVDIGANLGQMSGLLALRAGPAGCVLAFEPHPEIFAELASNVELFRRDPRVGPIEIRRVALAASPGIAWLDPGEGFASNRGLAHLVEAPGKGILVETTTLDAVLQGRTAALVKIDVEEQERNVLRGAVQCLREGRIRSLILEAGPEEERRLVVEILESSGYTVFGLGRTFFGPVLTPAGAPPHLPPWEAPNLVASRTPGEVLSRLRPRGWKVLSRSTVR